MPNDVPAAAPELPAEVAANLPRARLEDLCAGHRFDRLDRLHAYFRCTQDDGKEFDWDGYFRGVGFRASIEPGWYVPVAQRRPAATMPLAREIVGRLTSMLLGVQNRPTLHVAGDADAEAFARAIAAESRLFQRFVEARNLGGSCGAVAVSYGLVEACPRIEVHCSKHVRVLKWRDRAELIPEVVLKAYRYADETFDPESKRFVSKLYWYVRYWDTRFEYVWRRIPDAEVVDDPSWYFRHVPDAGVEHGDGSQCPVVWVQNVPCGEDVDSESDFAGMLDNLDELNRLESATARGTLKNADPTLIIRSAKKASAVKKGSGVSIFAEGGAEYLTLPGDAMRAALEEKEALRRYVLGACQVVAPSAEKLSGAAQSAAAIRLLYAPMTAKCDVLREQYGELGLARVLEGLLRVCRAALARGEAVKLPPREATEVDELTGEARTVTLEHVPGAADAVTLSWPSYFPPTWQERVTAVDAATKATGGKPVLSQRSAIASIGALFGVEDAEVELAEIKADAERRLAAQGAELAMFGGLREPLPGLEPESDDDDDDEEEEGSGPIGLRRGENEDEDDDESREG